jgi:hypothetical protein
MGGQGFVPNEGKGALASGSNAADEGPEHDPEPAAGAAPRAGMQGRPDRGAAPEPILERPGTTPAATPGTGGKIGTEPPQQDRTGRVKGPHLQDPADAGPLAGSATPAATSGAEPAPQRKK